MISSEKKPVYWPGVCFALAGVYHIIAISLHVYTFGFKDACILSRREKSSGHSFMPTEGEVDMDEQERERQYKLKLQASPGIHTAV